MVISSIAIGACLSSEFAKAAPASSIKALSSLSLKSNTSALATKPLLGSTGLQIFFLVAATTTVGYLGIQQTKINQKKEQNRLLKAQLTQAPKKSTRNTTTVHSSGGGHFRPDAALLAEAYYEAQFAGDAFETDTLTNYLGTLDEVTLTEILSQSASTLLPRKHQRDFIPIIAQKLSSKNSEQAVRTIFEAYERDESQDFRNEAVKAFSYWLLFSFKNSDTAIAWLEEQENSITTPKEAKRVLFPFREKTFSFLLQDDYDDASDYLVRFDEKIQAQLLSYSYSLSINPHSRGYSETDADSFLKLSNRFEEKNRQEVLQSLVNRRDGMPRLEWIDELYQNEHLVESDRGYLVEEGAKSFLNMRDLSMGKIDELHHWLHEKDPVLSHQRFGQSFPNHTSQGIRLANAYSKHSTNHEWIAHFFQEAHFPFFRAEMNRNEAYSLAEKIPSPSLREQTLNKLSLQN